MKERRRNDYIAYMISGLVLAGLIGIGAWVWNKFTTMCDAFPVITYKMEMLNKKMDVVEQNNKLLEDLKNSQEVLKNRQNRVIVILNKLVKINQLQDKMPQLNEGIGKGRILSSGGTNAN